MSRSGKTGKKPKKSGRAPRGAAAEAEAQAQASRLIELYRGGRLQEALDGARAFTERWPGLAVGWNVLAASHQAAGHPDEAARAYLRAVRLEPANADAHNNLGLMLIELQRLEEAEQACRNALSQRPDFPEAHYNLGLVLSRLGRTDEAAARWRRVVEIRPGWAGAHSALADLYRDSGRLDDAIDAYRRALAADPRAVALQVNLAGVLRQAGRPTEAVEILRQAREQWPDDGGIHDQLGLALRDAGRPVEAERAFRRALELWPDAAGGYRNLGNLLMDRGRLGEAETLHRQALELEPASAQAHRDLGVTLAVLGRADEAATCLQQAIALRADFAEAYYQLAAVKRFTPDDPDLAAMERLLAVNDLPVRERELLHYAAGKARADTGDEPETALGHWREAGRLARRALDYDVAADEARLADIARAFPIERLAGVAVSEADGPVFIVGMPRSGTTLVEQILASHPRVHGAGERFDLERIVGAADREYGTAFPEWCPQADAGELAEMGRRYRAAVVDSAPEADRVTDKLPDNFRFLGLIALAMPEARIVHIRRDPVDTCLSCFQRRFVGRGEWSYDLAELGRYYRAYAELMAHWHRVLPAGVMLEMRYEDLIAEPERESRRAVAHCGLEWDPACLTFHTTERAVPTASLVQVRQPLYASAVGRWRRYEDELQPLLEALGPLAPER